MYHAEPRFRFDSLVRVEKLLGEHRSRSGAIASHGMGTTQIDVLEQSRFS